MKLYIEKREEEVGCCMVAGSRPADSPRRKYGGGGGTLPGQTRDFPQTAFWTINWEQKEPAKSPQDWKPSAMCSFVQSHEIERGFREGGGDSALALFRRRDCGEKGGKQLFPLTQRGGGDTS